MNSVSWPGISESTRHRLLNRPALVAARPPHRRARGPTAIGPLAVSVRIPVIVNTQIASW